MFTGNRGIIHDPATKTLTRRWASQAWLTCVCEFRGRRREVMGGRSWTELFFLDEATALAAGHRPCFFCRRDDANRFRAAWEEGNGVALCSRATSTPCCIASGSARQEAAACASDAAGRIARRRDAAARGRELSDRAGPGAIVVAGRLSQAESAIERRDAADAALDAARAGSGISAGAASECRRC
jgi:hypothetical protein